MTDKEKLRVAITTLRNLAHTLDGVTLILRKDSLNLVLATIRAVQARIMQTLTTIDVE